MPQKGELHDLMGLAGVVAMDQDASGHLLTFLKKAQGSDSAAGSRQLRAAAGWTASVHAFSCSLTPSSQVSFCGPSASHGPGSAMPSRTMAFLSVLSPASDFHPQALNGC